MPSPTQSSVNNKSLQFWVENKGERAWFVGERVRDKNDGYAATVRYIGPVASAKDHSVIYIGVEWDDSTRGKHDGSTIVKNSDATEITVRYFFCAQGAGSFLKPKKLARGETFVEVMRRRYVSMEAQMVSTNNKLDIEECNVKTWNGRALPIEFFGELQIRSRQQLEKLERVTCRDDNLSLAGDIGDVEKLTPLVWLLDLQGNLLYDWKELADICKQLPRLRQLRINGNRMHMETLYRPALAITQDGCAFDCLRVLVLNSCGLTSWKQVALIEKGLPSIEEVSLAYNDLSDLEPSLLQLQAATIYSSGMPSISASSIASCLAPSGSDEFIAPNASSPEMEHQGDEICRVGGLSVPSNEWNSFVAEAVINADWLKAEATHSSSFNTAAATDIVLKNKDCRFPPVTGFRFLKHLDLSNTGLVSWRQVLRFAWLPKLQQLHLTDNRIDQIWPLPNATTDVITGAREAAANLNSNSNYNNVGACVSELYTKRLESSNKSKDTLVDTSRARGDPKLGGTRPIFKSTSSSSESQLLVGPAGAAIEVAADALPFGRIFYISLSGTSLNSWASIDALNGYGVHSGGEANIAAAEDISKNRIGLGLEEVAAAQNAINMEKEAAEGNFKLGIRVMRLSGNSTPLITGMGASEVRMLCVARMPFLTILNGSHVRMKERVEAEKSYVRRVMRNFSEVCEKVGGGLSANDVAAAVSRNFFPSVPHARNSLHPIPSYDSHAVNSPSTLIGSNDEAQEVPTQVVLAAQDIVKLHPRFPELFMVYGATLTPLGTGGTGSLAAEIIEVRILSVAAGSIEKQPLWKKIPASLPVGQLKIICKKVFDLEPDMQTLYYETGDKLTGSYPAFLDDDYQTIGFFGVCSGTTIYMNEVDLKAAERDREAWADEQRKREEEQLRRLGSYNAMKHAERGAELAHLKGREKNI